MSDKAATAGTALGGISLFVQLFDKCTQAFSLWQEGKEIGSDTTVFKIRLEMQAARLKEWGLNWGVGNGQRALHLFEPRFKAYGDLAIQYMATINHLLDVLNSTASAIPALVSGSNFPLSAASHLAKIGELGDSGSSGRNPLLNKISSIRNEATATEELSWASNQGKATRALELIKSMIDELYSFFDPARSDTAAHIVFNSCLTSLNLDLLDKIKDTCNDDPLLQGLAYLKTATNQLKTRGTALDYIDVSKKLRLLKEIKTPDARNSRAPGSFNNVNVLVEWKNVSLEPTASNPHLTLYLIEQRAKNVGRLLKVDLKPHELRTLDCLGVVTKSDIQGAGNH